MPARNSLLFKNRCGSHWRAFLPVSLWSIYWYCFVTSSKSYLSFDLQLVDLEIDACALSCSFPQRRPGISGKLRADDLSI